MVLVTLNRTLFFALMKAMYISEQDTGDNFSCDTKLSRSVVGDSIFLASICSEEKCDESIPMRQGMELMNAPSYLAGLREF